MTRRLTAADGLLSDALELLTSEDPKPATSSTYVRSARAAIRFVLELEPGVVPARSSRACSAVDAYFVEGGPVRAAALALELRSKEVRDELRNLTGEEARAVCHRLAGLIERWMGGAK